MIRIIQIILIITDLVLISKSVYISKDNVSVIEGNPAIHWSDEGIWGTLLEEWTLSRGTSHRAKRVMKLPPTPDAYIMDDRPNDEDKEGKIAPGKVVNNKPNGLQVTETDLYLLGAIEKLVYRVDSMEKRLRRVEEMLHYVMAGNRIDHHDACPVNFTRIGTNCYSFSSAAGREYDWKVAHKQCKQLRTNLVEFETFEEERSIVNYIQNEPHLRGKDFWTGGLNPGLLWIWSNTARPIGDNKTTILGDGRCLRLAHDRPSRSYHYKGTDCSVRYSYICELAENVSSNEIRRLGYSKNIITD